MGKQQDDKNSTEVGSEKMSREEIVERIESLINNGNVTNTKTTQKALDRFKNGETDEIKVILANGMPPGTNQCSECKEILQTDQFSYYQTRVDERGYLARSKALCYKCRKSRSKNTKTALDRAEKEGKIPPKPEPGSICPECNRAWSNRWHRDHSYEKGEQGEFRQWICNLCNMKKHDRRDRPREDFNENDA